MYNLTPPENERFTMIASNSDSPYERVCGLRKDGRVLCWGFLGWPLTSMDDLKDFLLLTRPELRFKFITGSCGLLQSGELFCWENPYSFDGPVAPLPEDGTFITLGGDCAIREDGSAACWGDLIDGNTIPPEDERFASVSHPCGIRLDGSVLCWEQSIGIEQVSQSGERFVSISASSSHACALRDDDAVVCWGENHHGQASPPEVETK